MNQTYSVHLEDVPDLTSRGGLIKIFACPGTLGTTKLIMGVATLKPGEEIGQHVHDYGEEVVLVIKGTGYVMIEDEKIRIGEGISFIAKQGLHHRIINDDEQELVLVFASAPLAPSKEQGHRDIK